MLVLKKLSYQRLVLKSSQKETFSRYEQGSQRPQAGVLPIEPPLLVNPPSSLYDVIYDCSSTRGERI